MSWISEMLGALVDPAIEIERWNWEQKAKPLSWVLVIEGPKLCIKEQFSLVDLANCPADEAAQSKIILRLRKIIGLFADVSKITC